jgi:hypothetical protein
MQNVLRHLDCGIGSPRAHQPARTNVPDAESGHRLPQA